ncbi:MAG: hypothetical protein ACI9U2_004476 [Bradymonadia bacterium]|jgi:hypothetical protein
MLLRAPITALGVAIVGITIAASLAGCLVPYPIEERPIEINYPPFYIDGTLSPTTDSIREFDPRVEEDVLFRVALDDPNISDQLVYRWFINYNPVTGAPIAGDTLQPGEARTVSYKFRPCLESQTGETIHRIDLFVADRAFLSGPPSNQRVAAGTGTLKLTWFVRLDDLCSPLL